MQVSLPPKLNHRFELKDFAPNTWKLSRTGWYYRVLREDTVEAGDEIRLVERKHPKWTIERIREYLHRNTRDLAINEELAAIPEFGKESHDAFASRVAKQKAKAKKSEGNDAAAQWRDFRIVEKIRQTSRITSFVLEAVNPLKEPGRGHQCLAGASRSSVRTPSLVATGTVSNSGSRGMKTPAEGPKCLHPPGRPGHVDADHHLVQQPRIRGSGSRYHGLSCALRYYNFDASLHYAVRSAYPLEKGSPSWVRTT